MGVDTGPVNNELYTTRIRARLLEAWLRHAKDPGLPICQWLWEGAPAGLECDVNCLDGLFPRVPEEETELSPGDLVTDFDAFTNYTGVDEDDDVANISIAPTGVGESHHDRQLSQQEKS